jgi:HD-GYP domain-containing protein (c-di-GMP phosphodiesterase class II)
MEDFMNTSFAIETNHETHYRIVELEERFQQQSLAMATSLVSLIDLRDRYTGGHSQRVAKYVRGIAMQMCLSDEEAEMIVFAASLHDIGKIGVPDHILLKQSRLDDLEFEWIRKHPEWGWMAVRNVDGFQEAALLILHHHERLDGQGYPSRLQGSEIPLGARIIAVADSYDALTTNRPYRTARTRAEALDELFRCRDVQFDYDVLKAFSASLERVSGLPKRFVAGHA